MISTGYSNPTPWRCPRDISEEQLGDRIEALTAELGDARRAIFNFHVPPYHSGIDQCAKLDTTVAPPRPVMGEEITAGRRAVHAAIERHEPVLAPHGHIHGVERRAADRAHDMRQSGKRIRRGRAALGRRRAPRRRRRGQRPAAGRVRWE